MASWRLVATASVAPSPVSESSGAASSNIMPVPAFAKVQSRLVLVHTTKMGEPTKISSIT